MDAQRDLLPPLTEPVPVPLEDQLREVDREIGLREFWYPKWVAAHKMTQANADIALARMKAVRRTLANLKENT